MEEENQKRTNIEDLPRAEEAVSDDDAKNVQGGLTKVGPGTLTLNPTTSSGVSGRVGGIAVDPSDPSGNT